MKCRECPDYAKCVKESNLKIKRKSCKKAKTEYVMTNADRIRAMSDEELVVFLDEFSSRCIECVEDAKNKSCPIYKEGRYCRPRDIMEWLQQPMKGE